jgi:SAM-dependent methyltransferase
MFIGNLPDLDRVGNLFEGNTPSADELKRYDTLFGIWRTEQEMAKLAAECGWRAEFSRMPSTFYGASHRFDATLVKRSPNNTITTPLRPIGQLSEPVTARWCVFCQQSVESWVSFHLEPSDFVRRIGSIGSNIKRFQCPHCWSTDRERHLRLFVEQLHLFEPIRTGSVLHMAPEPRLSEFVLTYTPALYIKGDLFPSHESIQKIDLQKIPFSDETFDIVICNHMLEHVDDPAAGLRELRRVLKPGARIICQTPYASRLARTLEEPLLQSPDDRVYFYGQNDHLRFFGKDIGEIITKAGFLGRLVPHEEILPELDPESCGVNEKEPFFDFVRA